MKPEYNENRRKLYNERKLWGICVTCGKPLGKDETTICCTKCLTKRREWASAHRNQLHETQRRFKTKNKAAGLCVQCNSPAEEGFTLCAFHRVRSKELQKKRKERIASEKQSESERMSS